MHVFKIGIPLFSDNSVSVYITTQWNHRVTSNAKFIPAWVIAWRSFDHTSIWHRYFYLNILFPRRMKFRQCCYFVLFNSSNNSDRKCTFGRDVGEWMSRIFTDTIDKTFQRWRCYWRISKAFTVNYSVYLTWQWILYETRVWFLL